MESSLSKKNLLESQLVDLDIKKVNSWQYKGDSKTIKINETFKFNIINIKKNKIVINPDSDNLFTDKLMYFKDSEMLEKKQEKILIENFLVYPTCCFGQIFTSFKKDNKFEYIIGTGTLIGPNVVLTSASNISRKNICI